jgi:Cu+-exporting ATPase
MAKDPNCGMEVDEGTALSAVKDGNVHYFCSTGCMNAFLGSTKDTSSSPPVDRLSDHKTQKVATITLPVLGMTCASCATTIEGALHRVDGVLEANVNFGTERVLIRYDREKTAPPQLEQAVTDAGYEVVKGPAEQTAAEGATLRLRVIGMDNPHCVGTVSATLEHLAGVISQDCWTNETATVRYDPKLVTADRIMGAIRDVGYTPLPLGEGVDTEREAREKEIATLRRRTVAAFVLALPLALLVMLQMAGIGLPDLIADNRPLLMLLLTTPIMYVGRQFFIHGIGALPRTRTATMDTLIAIGTGTAFN